MLELSHIEYAILSVLAGFMESPDGTPADILRDAVKAQGCPHEKRALAGHLSRLVTGQYIEGRTYPVQLSGCPAVMMHCYKITALGIVALATTIDFYDRLKMTALESRVFKGDGGAEGWSPETN